MNNLLVARIAAAGTAVFIVGAAWLSTSTAAAQIQLRSEQTLQQAGLPSRGIQVQGRSVVVTSDLTDSQQQQAQALLVAMPGVTEVTFDPSQPTAAPSPTATTTTGSTPSTPAASPTGAPTAITTEVAPQVTIRFTQGSAELDATAARDVAQVADYLKRYAGVSVVLIGRASAEGGGIEAMTLATQRAQRVADAVIATGIDSARVRTATTGDVVVDSPAMANLMRRVDVVFEEQSP